MQKHYKRNQVEEAIFRTLDAHDERVDELRFRLKRLLVTDRRLGCNAKSAEEEDRHYAFYSQKPPGSGTEVMFSAYEAFALLAAILMLEHGMPQASVVRVMRLARKRLEVAHAETLRKDWKKLFDRGTVMALARVGSLEVNNTDPVFLVIAGYPNSSSPINIQSGRPAIAVCKGQKEVGDYLATCHRTGATFFEYVGYMHRLAVKISQTQPVKRGRGAT